MKNQDRDPKSAARSRRRLRAALSSVGISAVAVASLGLLAAGVPSGEAPAEAVRAAPSSAPVARTKDAPPLVEAVDWSRVETVADPGPTAIGEHP